MKKLLQLITIIIWSATFGQTDTLKSNEVEFEILNSKSGIIENFESEILILSECKDLNKTSKGLIFLHGRNNHLIYKVSFKPSKTCDTIKFSYPGQVFPNDKFYLEYDSKRIEYLINSTVYANKRPYYMDFKFLLNGDTVKSNNYEILNFRNNIIDETTIRIENFGNQEEVKVKHKGQTIKIDLLKKRKEEPIFHGLMILSYIDNFKKLTKNENYSRPTEFAKAHDCKKITMFRLFDSDSKLGYEKNNGMFCVD